jgi:hypothetical protein
MYFAYGPGCDGWIEDRKFELARSLRELVGRYGREEEPAGEGPYVEVDGSGVRLRCVTSLDEDEREKMKMNGRR